MHRTARFLKSSSPLPVTFTCDVAAKFREMWQWYSTFMSAYPPLFMLCIQITSSVLPLWTRGLYFGVGSNLYFLHLCPAPVNGQNKIIGYKVAGLSFRREYARIFTLKPRGK